MAESTQKDESAKEQKVDPWTVKAAEGEATINYDKLIGRFDDRGVLCFHFSLLFSSIR